MIIEIPDTPLKTNQDAIVLWSRLARALYKMSDRLDDFLPATVAGDAEDAPEDDPEAAGQPQMFFPFSQDTASSIGAALDGMRQAADTVLGAYTRTLDEEAEAASDRLPVPANHGYGYPQQHGGPVNFPGGPMPGGPMPGGPMPGGNWNHQAGYGQPGPHTNGHHAGAWQG